MYKNEQGNLIILALLILILLSLIGTTLVTMAGMESKMVINENMAQQALLAADAGLEIARNIIIEKSKAGIPLNDGTQEDIESTLQGYKVDLRPNLYTSINIVDTDNFNRSGEITVSATGKYQEVTKTVTATYKFNNMPSEPIRADILKVAGRYNEIFERAEFIVDSLGFGWEIETNYEPWGEVIVSGGSVSTNKISNSETDSYFNTELIDYYLTTMLPQRYLYRPPKVFNSFDFLVAPEVIANEPSISFSTEDVANFYNLAQANPEKWDIWDINTFSFNRIEKPYNFVTGSTSDSLDIEIRNNIWTNLQDWVGSYWKGDDSPKTVVIVSDAELNLNINGDNIWLDDVYLYLLSSSGINIDNRYEHLGIKERNAEHSFTTYVLSDQNINLSTYIENLYINGSLQAGNKLFINISDDGINWGCFDGEESKVFFEGENNRSLIDSFPYRWSFIGVGKTVIYKQE